MNGMNALKAIFLAAVMLVCAVGCGLWDDAGPPPDLPETWLSEIIRTVPSDMGAEHLMFANPEAARVEADATDFQGLDTVFGSGGLSSIPWTYDGLPDMPLFTSYHSGYAVETLGLDTLVFDQGIWDSKPIFSITIGGLDDPPNLSTRLMEVEYKADAHGETSFLYFWRDKPPAPRFQKEHPMRMTVLNLNAIALIEDKLVIAMKPPMLEGLIDVQEGNAPSLWDEESWRVLTRMVGDELLGGALLSPEYVASRTETGTFINRSAEERLEDWERYASGPDAWGTLEPYTALVLGYSVRDEVEGATIAMYHPDPDSAERNAAELKRRWESAHLDLRRYIYSGPSDQSLDPEYDIPFSELCSPLETRTETYAEASILIATCPAIEQSDPTLTGTLGRDFWKGLVEHHELHFLVPDIAELTGGQ